MINPNMIQEALPPIPPGQNSRTMISTGNQHKIYPNPPPEIQTINIRDPPSSNIPIGIPLHNNSNNPNSNCPFPGYQINYPYSRNNNIVLEDDEPQPKIQKFMSPDLNPNDYGLDSTRDEENNGELKPRNEGKKYNYYSSQHNRSTSHNQYIRSTGINEHNVQSELCYCCVTCRNPCFCMRNCRINLNCFRCGKSCRNDCSDLCKCCCKICDSGCLVLILGICKLLCVLCKLCLECLVALLGN